MSFVSIVSNRNSTLSVSPPSGFGDGLDRQTPVSLAALRKLELALLFIDAVKKHPDLPRIERIRSVRKYLSSIQVHTGSRTVSLAEWVKLVLQMPEAWGSAEFETRFRALPLERLKPFLEVSVDDLRTVRPMFREISRIRKRLRDIRESGQVPAFMVAIMLEDQIQQVVDEHPNAWHRIEECLARVK